MGEQLQHQHRDAFSPQSTQLSCVTHRHGMAWMPEAWVTPQNDTIDSERRIIFVTEKKAHAMPGHATRNT